MTSTRSRHAEPDRHSVPKPRKADAAAAAEGGKPAVTAPGTRKPGPYLTRKKFRRTRRLWQMIVAANGISWEYVRRTYQEGKHIDSFWQGYRQCRTRKPQATILKELYLVARKWKVFPFNYFRNALYDRTTPYADEFLSFIPEPALYTRYMPILSPEIHRILVHNKYFFHQLLKLYGIDSPPVVLWSFDQVIYSKNGIVLNENDLNLALDDQVSGSLVLKPQYLSSGKAIEFLSLARSGGSVRLEGGLEPYYGFTELRATCDRLGNWQLEEAVKQHPLVTAIYPDSVNTVRLVTLAYPDGEIRVLAALMRLGRHGSKIDNASAGGVHIHIDVASGQFLDPAYSKTDNATYSEHPDTGHPFAGVTLPFWDEVVALAKRGAGLFMQTHTIAWDIAIGEAGPIVIEGNPTWNPGTMERGSYPKGDIIRTAAEAWQAHKKWA